MHIKLHKLRKEKDVPLIFVLQETKNTNLFDKTQGNIKRHIQHGKS